MKKLIVFLTTFMLAGTMMAQTIGVEDAQNKALQFMQGQSQTRAAQREVQLKLAYTSKSGDETYYYVFNNSAGGYVIMGGDEAAREVLGYGETGSFDYERIPDNMRWWLSQYDAQISQVIREVKAGTNKVVRQPQTRAERADIPVMLTTKWGQDKPYNMQLPTSQSGEVEYHTGCSVTAMAQIMNYHRWPDTGVGSNTLDTLYYGHKFTADFENTHYDWEAMADSYEKTYSGTREEIAVGTLMYHLGVAFNSTYKLSGTGTIDLKVLKALVEHFRYNKGLSYLYHSSYNNTDWEEIVYDELSANRPVFYGGLTEKGLGHSFVCDGYREGLWHINWGWEGNFNNYFLITPTSTEKALLPDGTGTGGGAAGDSYSINQVIITGIYPDPEGNSKYKKTLSFIHRILDHSLVAPGDTVQVPMKFQNLGLREETFEIRYKLVNIDDANDTHQLENVDEFTFEMYGFETIEPALFIPEGVRRGANYEIIPMFKDEKGEWKQTLKDVTSNYSRISIGNEFALTNPVNVFNNGYICNDVLKVFFGIRNCTDNTISCPLIINVYPYDEPNAEPVDYFDLSGITLSPREKCKYIVGLEDLHFGDRMEYGKEYLLQLENSVDGNPYGAYLCLYLETLTIPLEVPEMGWTTFAIPFNSEIPEGLKAYRVSYYNDIDSIILTEVDYLYMDCAYLLHGVPGSYQFVGPARELDNAYYGCLYTLDDEGPLRYSNSYVLEQLDGIVGFYRIQKPTNIGKYEAYLVSNSSKDEFPIQDPDADDPTSLHQIITPGTPIDSRIYDLNGRIINADHKGILIRGSKVYIIK